MTEPQRIYALATLLGAVGMWLLLPRGLNGLARSWEGKRGRTPFAGTAQRVLRTNGVRPLFPGRGRLAGAVLVAAALGLGAAQMPRLGEWLGGADVVFLVLSAVTVVAAIGAVTLRNAVYCAIWFGLSLLGTSGLMLFLGAQFLAMATVVVYAGAILVTFLFVLMLAEPEGRAVSDRTSWEALLSAVTGTVIVGILSMTVSSVLTGPQPSFWTPVAAKAPAAEALQAGVLAPEHVAQVGQELFGRHLIAVEVAGVLLLVALVAAAVILAPQRTREHEESVRSR